MGKVIRVNVRAGRALDLARALAQRVQFRTVEGRETGYVWGHPEVLRVLCSYIGAGKRETSRWSVYLEVQYRMRLKTIKGTRQITAAA